MDPKCKKKVIGEVLWDAMQGSDRAGAVLMQWFIGKRWISKMIVIVAICTYSVHTMCGTIF